MSKPVLGLLAGLAVLAAAGRARKGSFAKRYTVYAKSAVEARAKFAKAHPHLRVLGSKVDENYGSGPGLPDLSGYYEYIITAETKGGSFFKDPYRLSYEDAYEQARQTATRLGRDVGIMKNAFGGYSVFALPNPENRRGHELRCEVVRPGSPAPRADRGIA
jgi:hypothetical protein